MNVLPPNKPKDKDLTPKRFFIFGDNMTGKTYLACQFPNPLLINTDGNADKVSIPSRVIYDFESFVEILGELEKGNHTYETVIIDLIDDIKTMLQVYVAKKYGYETDGEVPYGNGRNEVKTKWQQLMVRLMKLPYYIIFISYIDSCDEDGQMVEIPSLEPKFCKLPMGRTDVAIKTRKIGNNYIQICSGRREAYKKEDISDVRVLNILQSIKGVFSNNTPVMKLVEKKIEKSSDI